MKRWAVFFSFLSSVVVFSFLFKTAPPPSSSLPPYRTLFRDCCGPRDFKKDNAICKISSLRLGEIRLDLQSGVSMMRSYSNANAGAFSGRFSCRR